MATITLITGGARSGKSDLAVKLAQDSYATRAFIATAEALDDEMRERIGRHKQDRGERFLTIEEPVDLGAALRKIPTGTQVAVVDCLTVWLGNLFHHSHDDEAQVSKRIDDFVAGLGGSAVDLIFVTNEVGWGIVPENPLGRRFRDLAGRLNRMIAAKADIVYLCVSGIPLKIKEKQ